MNNNVKMKIKPDHLETLKAGINKVLESIPDLVSEYEKGNFYNAEKVKNLQERFCFDLLYIAQDLNYIPSGFVTMTLYEYMNDDHLYTALKAVCPKIERRY